VNTFAFNSFLGFKLREIFLHVRIYIRYIFYEEKGFTKSSG
jgi:hypothetical protein